MPHDEEPEGRDMRIPVTLAALLLAAGGAQAHTTLFSGTFGPEAPGATGTGTLLLEYDHDGHTLLIQATFAGLSGTTTVAHIHCCTAVPATGTAGVALASGSPANLPGWPAGAQSGSYTQLIDLAQTTSYTASFVTASGGTAALAEARLMANLESQNAYFNIHTSTFGGGEIRAFVNVVPEPSAWALMALGLAGVGIAARRRVA
jgi:hypothetical protein